MAHAIGKELAEKMWGDDFEVIVTTHLDKKHLHNHFVVNSVSWVTHKRFLNKHRDYAKFRQLSDELCLKYKLSIIDNPKKGMHYAEWKATKQKIPTRRSLMIDDVERALMNTMTFSQFIRNLKNLGYEVKTNVKHVAIKPPGATKFFRLHNLTRDERYSEENIRQRILNNESLTRNWTQEQINDILSGKKPKFDGKTIQGHHTYSASQYPQLANRGEIIYPVTQNEHFKGWHGGNWKNSLPGRQIDDIYDF